MQKQRSYYLDVLKFVFTVLVFYSHTSALIDNHNIYYVPTGLGWISVHFFFIVSGCLMIDGYMKNKIDEKNRGGEGKEALLYVLGRFSRIAIPYWVSLGIRTAVQIILYARDMKTGTTIVFRLFPEIFGVHMTGILPQIANPPAWYISAMLVAMLPLYYLLSKNADFFLHVFAPLGALLTFAWMFSKDPHLSQLDFQTFLNGAMIRAFCGLCFGGIAWLLCDYFRKLPANKFNKFLFTIVELFSWSIFFIVILKRDQWYVLEYSVMMLLPITIAIAYSGISLLSQVCNFKLFKYLAPLSLAIYLNHSGAVQIVIERFKGNSFLKSMMIASVLTIIISVIYFILIWVIKRIWGKMQKRLHWKG